MADDLEVLEALVADLPSGRYREFLDDVQNHPGNRLADQEPGTNAISPPSSSSYVPPTKTETLVKPSGWTSRYGVSRKTPNVGGGRSWIDPDFPRLSHDTFEPVNPPDPGDTIPEPHSEDLDRLFQTEEMQRLALGGMRTWEAALMVQEEENMPKETEPLASSGTLADSDMIDESKWFRVLGKNRWICDFEEFVDGGGENRKWSVDDALLWAELRQVLDITNRILKQAAHTRWMSTFLDMRTIRATKNVRLPKGGKSKEKGTIWRATERDSDARFDVSDCIEAIDHFCEDVNFTFNSVNRNSEAPNGCPYGVTGPLVIDGRQSILIQVDTMGALALIKPGVSETSKRHARALLAITITHEILFMFDELLSEMGESFENAVFGGVADLSAHPLDIYRFSGSTNGAALLASNIKWPVLKPSTWESYSIRIDLEYPYIHESSPVPALYTCATTTKDFWESTVAKYGSDALRMPRVFATHVTTGFDVTCVPAAWNHDLKTNASLERPLKQMARRIQYRRKQYEEWRPWYKEAYDEWRNSPYGNVRNRYDLEKVLNKHLVGRTFADERDIADIISTWSNPLVWPNAGPEELPWLLDSHDMIDKSNWFYRAMCMLITAVLPIRFEPVHVNPRKGHMPELVKNPWTVRPSVLEGQPEEQRAFLNRVADSAYRESDPIENTADFVLNFPCHKLDWEQGKEPYSIKDPRSPRALRRHFLHEAAGYFKIYENVCAAPLGLKEAFEAALKDVAAQVGNLADPGVNREGTWLNLNFAMAGYTRASQKTCLYRTVEQYRPIWGRDADPDPVDTSLPTWAQMVDVIEPLEDRHRVMYQWTPADIVEQNSGNGREVCIIERRTVYLVYFWDAVKPPEKSPLYDEYYSWVSMGRPIPLQHGDLMLDIHVSNNNGQFNPEALTGRFIPEYREHEVALRDGQDGQPFWIVLERNIFDITNWTSPIITEEGQIPLHTLLRSVPGGSPAHKVIMSQYDLSEVRRSLWETRVGTVWAGEMPQTRTYNVYTRREVAAHRYLNKECPLGAYIIIWNNVYDVTEWARLHPAGIQLIAPHVGKDVSDIFRKNHHYLAILSAIEHLRIGRIVPEHDPDKRVPPHTFTHHDTLISFQPDWIQDTPRGELYRSVWNDNSPWAIDDEGIFADKHLYSLEKRRVVETMRGSMELITHKIRRPPFEDVAQMLPAILEDFNGQRIDEWTLALAFVAVNEWVYDVTNVMRYGIEEEKAKLSPWVGRAIDDEEIRNWVIETFEFAVVAQLVNEITEDPDQCENWDPRIPDHKPDQIYKKLISLVASSGAKSKKRKREDEETTETTEDLIAPIKRPKPDSEGSDASDDSFARYFEPPADDPDSDVHLWGTAMMVRPSLTPGNGGGDGEPPDERPTERNDPWNREAKAPNRSSSYSPGRSGRRTASGRERGNGPRGSGSTRPHASSPGPSRSRTPDFDPLDIIDQRELQTSLRHKLSALAERSKVVKPARRRDARRAQAEASRSSPGSSRSNTTTPEKGRKSPSKARPDPATPTRSPARRTPAQQPVHREQPRENLPAARGGWLSKSEKRRRAIDEVLYREQAPAPRVVAGTARPMGPEEMSMMRRAVMQVDADRERMMQWKDTRETKQIRPSLDALTKLAVDREEERNIEMEEWKRAEAWLAEQVEKAKANLAKGPEIRTNPPTGQPAVPATSTSLPIVGGPRPAPTDALAQERLALQRLAQGSLAAAKLEQETEEYQRLCVVLNGSIPQLGAPFTFASKEERAREKASLTARLEEETPTRKQGPAKGPRTARDDPARAAARRALEQRAAAELSDFEARGLRGQLQPREMIPVLRERFRREILRRTPQYNIGLRGHMERVLSRVNLADYMPRVSTYVHNEEEEDIYGPS
ncbi:hypothetical protein BN1708_007464 [Verticillium longisporum]|uniref:Cytochrome b5 heme-binding domain-containing protein n=1 Tax=Verticillium longisporum TaxID=100787 RepID=A0A0G4MTZ9_VERLO|nr:hypothetical protein BN1708_007464 [Verticillium longisporum]